MNGTHGSKPEVVDAESERDFEAEVGIGAGHAGGRKELLGLPQHGERGLVQGTGRATWPLPDNLDEATLEAKSYPAPSQTRGGKAMPDMVYIRDDRQVREPATLSLSFVQEAVNIILLGPGVGKRHLVIMNEAGPTVVSRGLHWG